MPVYTRHTASSLYCMGVRLMDNYYEYGRRFYDNPPPPLRKLTITNKSRTFAVLGPGSKEAAASVLMPGAENVESKISQTERSRASKWVSHQAQSIVRKATLTLMVRNFFLFCFCFVIFS